MASWSWAGMNWLFYGSVNSQKLPGVTKNKQMWTQLTLLHGERYKNMNGNVMRKKWKSEEVKNKESVRIWGVLSYTDIVADVFKKSGPSNLQKCIQFPDAVWSWSET